jgi:hypothetical protein
VAIENDDVTYHIKGAQASEFGISNVTNQRRKKEQNSWRAGISAGMISIFSCDLWFTIRKKVARLCQNHDVLTVAAGKYGGAGVAGKTRYVYRPSSVPI